jgi:uncharacterized protein (DUF1330 family)
MPAYWIARAKVDDPVAYKRYADAVPGIVAAYQGRILARGGKSEVLEGPDKFQRFVVIEFPTLDLARACHDSPEYAAASAHRKADGVGELELAITEGL